MQLYKKGKSTVLQGPFCAVQEQPICLEECCGERAFDLVVGLMYDEKGAKVEGWCETEVDRIRRCTLAMSV